ncbi:probable lipid phosphate phosphatase beta [Lotus japonicus]|uniref:probable lipid phosphate phosphatase beta n=1 Tax=Lotus japonicus TaxID=34305 RepID=UPI0025846E54|nr:probable lipid phosphate phosphatase beta [Lotus japonicus]XP_057416195.1 probable lipid phosphate phosphatase beta [Lotus japonicus]
MGGDPPPKPPTPPLLRHIASFDERISLHIHTLTTPLAPKLLLRLLEHLADFRFFFPVTLSLFFATPSSSPLRSHLLLPLILCSLLDLILIGLVKSLARRSRPAYATNNDYNAVVSLDNFSFPSGHSSRVSFIASIFFLSRAPIAGAIAGPNHPHLVTLVHRWIGGDEVLAVNLLVAAVWSWALTTVVSRVVLGRHYILDVLFGACFGVLEALITLRLLQYRALI